MNVAIRDPDVLRSIEPQAFIAYLRANSWESVDFDQQRAAVLENTINDNKRHIVIPLNTEFADYARRIAEALETLATFEHRSQYEVLNDLTYAVNDVIKLRNGHPSNESGTIQLSEGIKLYSAARDMMLAAASAALEPRAVYRTRQFTRAVEFVNSLKIGPSEAGSFIANIVSPVLTPTAEQIPFEEMGDAISFGSRVIIVLNNALVALQEVAGRVSIEEDVTIFDEVVKKGVSANLCKAVVELGTLGDKAGFDVSFKWSSTRRHHQHLRNRIRIQQSSLVTIQSAVEYFRDQEPAQDFELRGAIVRLSREQSDETINQPGEVVVHGEVHGNNRKVTIELPSDTYRIAVEAHKNLNDVSCAGQLEKTGRSYRLKQPRNFRVLEDED